MQQFQKKESHYTVKLSLTYANYDDGHGKLGTLQSHKKNKYYSVTLNSQGSSDILFAV